MYKQRILLELAQLFKRKRRKRCSYAHLGGGRIAHSQLAVARIKGGANITHTTFTCMTRRFLHLSTITLEFEINIDKYVLQERGSRRRIHRNKYRNQCCVDHQLNWANSKVSVEHNNVIVVLNVNNTIDLILTTVLFASLIHRNKAQIGVKKRRNINSRGVR